jgi:hypothetical protein
MNKENAHLFLPLVQALADGKTIQVNHGDKQNPQWEDAKRPEFSYGPEQYRVKPEPREWVIFISNSGSILHKSKGGPDSPSDAGYLSDVKAVRVREIL